MSKTLIPIRRLRCLTLIEGVSFLLLLGVAMPLKYLAGKPAAVMIVGWVHGVLFTLVLAALLHVWIVARWPMGRVVLVFVSALVPLGPFLIDRQMRRFEVDAQAAEEAAGR